MAWGWQAYQQHGIIAAWRQRRNAIGKPAISISKRIVAYDSSGAQ